MTRLQRGFTLIELVVVIVIVGIIAYIFLNFFNLGVDSYKLIDSRSDLTQNGRVVLQRMIREISQASSLTITSSTDISFTWDDTGNGVNDTSRYYLSGTDLRRTINGSNDTVILDNVSSLSFTGNSYRIVIKFTVTSGNQNLTIESSALRRMSLS
jgi:prepilin-type N-terminal cleavage/methylation domain-containing protein